MKQQHSCISYTTEEYPPGVAPLLGMRAYARLIFVSARRAGKNMKQQHSCISYTTGEYPPGVAALLGMRAYARLIFVTARRAGKKMKQQHSCISYTTGKFPPGSLRSSENVLTHDYVLGDRETRGQSLLEELR